MSYILKYLFAAFSIFLLFESVTIGKTNLPFSSVLLLLKHHLLIEFHLPQSHGIPFLYQGEITATFFAIAEIDSITKSNFSFPRFVHTSFSVNLFYFFLHFLQRSTAFLKDLRKIIIWIWYFLQLLNLHNQCHNQGLIYQIFLKFLALSTNKPVVALV